MMDYDLIRDLIRSADAAAGLVLLLCFLIKSYRHL